MAKHIAIDRKLLEDEMKKLSDFALKAKEAGKSPVNTAIELKDGGDCFSLGLAATFANMRTTMLEILTTQGGSLETLWKTLNEMVSRWDETEAENRNAADFYTRSKSQAASAKTV